MLRLAIGHDKNQKFKLSCQNCNQEIDGTLKLNQEKVTIKLILNGAKQVGDEHHDYVFTFHPFFPTQTSDNEFSSPFLDAARRNIENFPIQVMKGALFRRMAENDVKSLKKIYKNYKQRKWSHFSKSIKEIDPTVQLENQLDRNFALYQFLEFCVSPVVNSKKHSEIITFWVQYQRKLKKKDEKKFMDFVVFLNEKKILENIQNKSFNYTFRFFELEPLLTPIIFDWDPDKLDIKLPKDLKIQGDIPFDKIKSFYVDGFELACDALTIVQGLINIKYRLDFNSFPEHPTFNRGKPYAKNLEAFNNQQSNAPKLGILFEEKKIDSWLNSILDPSLRNAIGHGDIEFDETTEIIKYPTDKEKTEFVSMTYAEFLIKCIKMFTLIHQIHHLANMTYVNLHLPHKSSSASGLK